MLEAATAVDYAVNLVQVEHPASEELREAVYRLSHQAIDGLVVVQAGRAGREQLALPPSMPVAVSDSTLVDYYPSASADQVGGVRDAVTHLLELGHRTVHHVCGPEDSQSALIRKATWARTLRETGRDVPEAVAGDWEAAAGYEAGLRLATDPEVTAVFCANDELALGLIRAMHERGRRVPADVSVVGFDGLAVGEYSFPPSDHGASGLQTARPRDGGPGAGAGGLRAPGRRPQRRHPHRAPRARLDRPAGRLSTRRGRPGSARISPRLSRPAAGVSRRPGRRGNRV